MVMRTESRHHYDDAKDNILHLWGELRDAHPDDRPGLILQAADQYDRAAEAYRTGYDRPYLNDEGRVQADVLAAEATLLRLVADAERAATGRQSHRQLTGTNLEPVVGEVLNRMADTPGIEDRAALLEDLHAAVVPTVGGHAAEVIEYLPLTPGMTGWRQGQHYSQRDN